MFWETTARNDTTRYFIRKCLTGTDSSKEIFQTPLIPVEAFTRLMKMLFIIQKAILISTNRKCGLKIIIVMGFLVLSINP